MNLSKYTIQVKEELSKRDADLATEIAKAQSFSEEMVKKDEELLQKTQLINQLRNLGRKFKNLSTESDTKLKKVCPLDGDLAPMGYYQRHHFIH